MKTIGFFPYPIERGNEYTDIIIDAIQQSDKNISVEPFSHYKIIFGLKKYDIVWLNWYETLSHNFFSFIYELIAKIYIIQYLKIKKVKIITVFHDKIPHDTKYNRISKWLLTYLLKKSDIILVLNEASRQIVKDYIGNSVNKRIYKLPHPVYAVPSSKNIKDGSGFRVLFFGYLKPYKNIELVIELAGLNPEIEFTIAGSPVNKNYGRKLKDLCRDKPNVTLIEKRLSDKEMEGLVENCNLVILPYKLKSSLNSGVMIYAFTHQRNVIIPHIAAIDEFERKKDIFFYEYSEDDRHLEILNHKLHEAYAEFKTTPSLFRQRAVNLHEEIKKYNEEYLSEIIRGMQIL